MPIHSQKTHVRMHWKVEGALQSPCCMTLDLNVPYGVEIPLYLTHSASIWICLYASIILILDRYDLCTMQSIRYHMSGIRVMSNIVFTLRLWASMMVLKEPSFFAMHNNGHAIGMGWCTHQCAHS